MHPIIQEDHQRIHERIAPWLSELRNENVFMTGGTGFFGQWLLESLTRANDILGLNVQVTVLTRDPAAFKELNPDLGFREDIHLLEGDVRSFTFPKGDFGYIIHAATTRAEETFQQEDALKKYDTVVQGTRRVLEFAVQTGVRKVLWTSSGALYGPQPEEIHAVEEAYRGAPDPMLPDASALGIAKHSAEFLCAYFAKKHGFEVKIARCFSFVGPRLPLDIHYAVGNFIGDQVSGRDIIIRGDGLPERSYMYITDLVIWLWKIFLHGENLRPYNVGSSHTVNIKELAGRISELGKGRGQTQVLGASNTDSPINRYIPSIERAEQELDLRLEVKLQEALTRTYTYYNSI